MVSAVSGFLAQKQQGMDLCHSAIDTQRLPIHPVQYEAFSHRRQFHVRNIR